MEVKTKVILGTEALFTASYDLERILRDVHFRNRDLGTKMGRSEGGISENGY
jgi:hypothetical protein